MCALVSRLCVARVGIHDFAPCRCRNFNSPEQRAIFQFDFSICLVCRIAETNNWKVHMEHERIQRETERERHQMKPVYAYQAWQQREETKKKQNTCVRIGRCLCVCVCSWSRQKNSIVGGDNSIVVCRSNSVQYKTQTYFFYYYSVVFFVHGSLGLFRCCWSLHAIFCVFQKQKQIMCMTRCVCLLSTVHFSDDRNQDKI